MGHASPPAIAPAPAGGARRPFAVASVAASVKAPAFGGEPPPVLEPLAYPKPIATPTGVCIEREAATAQTGYRIQDTGYRIGLVPHTRVHAHTHITRNGS